MKNLILSAVVVATVALAISACSSPYAETNRRGAEAFQRYAASMRADQAAIASSWRAFAAQHPAEAERAISIKRENLRVGACAAQFQPDFVPIFPTLPEMIAQGNAMQMAASYCGEPVIWPPDWPDERGVPTN